jgi:hypothetical protein
MDGNGKQEREREICYTRATPGNPHKYRIHLHMVESGSNLLRVLRGKKVLKGSNVKKT